MIKGPCEYVPPVEVQPVKYHRAIPLDRNEGIYVRDTKTGAIKAIVGETYMLSEYEELWEKEMRGEIQTMLDEGSDPLANRSIASAQGKIGDFSFSQKGFQLWFTTSVSTCTLWLHQWPRTAQSKRK